ncbi:MAG: NAD(P)-binding protein [Candidatus Thermoplasmatota archaeon]|nr:NAD(P)-binding protein [Candidatus Thermoplasmatota archaeon]
MTKNRLSEKGTIGSLELRNRIVMAPMISNLANPDGSTNENHIAYLEERAKGGVSLIITEYSYINGRNARGSRNELGFHNSDFIPKLRRLTERVHSHEAYIFAQLVHAGGKAQLETNPGPPRAPSSVDYMGLVPDSMDQGEIDEAIGDFVRAASVARRSNFDGIELHGAHGYLIHSFLSPSLNHRNDSYGVNFEGRLKFAQSVIDAIRREVDINLGIRLSLYEDETDGYGPDYGLKIAEALHSVDYVHFSAGRFSPPGSSASFYEKRTHISERLPRKPAVTSIVAGSVLDGDDALRVLAKADFVAVGRALLADPFFAINLIHGRNNRPCIRCNQACRDITLGEVRCTVNPDTGFELYASLPCVEGVKAISIAGGGIKGMEAALFASRAGIKVTLYEMRDRLGGQLLDITDREKKEAFSALIRYYERALAEAKVDVRLNEKFDGEGLYCLPNRTYENLPVKRSLIVDSNIYRHQDEILETAKGTRVTVTERSLNSLDRVRNAAYRRKALSLGVEFAERTQVRPDISISERNQYDIRSAMIAGREAVRLYIASRRS